MGGCSVAEKGFVDALIKTINKFTHAVAVRPSDNYTMGIPDVLGWIPVVQAELGPPTVWSVAIEAKELRPLMEDPFHKGRRTGQMLKHPFTGPQVSMLRKLKASGVDAFGLVRVSGDTALRIAPEDIPAKTGNFTHEELVKFGSVVRRENGLWRFWEADLDQVLSSGHRNNPRE
jgi:hypothetical protein